eukprot:m.222428 g.222428  ORF g.222428 m.222428 type:complete len:139 (+) comp18735_c0_seq13:2160-2576(+)
MLVLESCAIPAPLSLLHQKQTLTLSPLFAQDLAQWKEVLGMLLTYAYATELDGLCRQLGARLEAAGQTDNAVLCYVCAGLVEGVVDKSAELGVSMPECVEQAAVLRRSVELQQVQPWSCVSPLCRVFVRIAFFPGGGG